GSPAEQHGSAGEAGVFGELGNAVDGLVEMVVVAVHEDHRPAAGTLQIGAHRFREARCIAIDADLRCDQVDPRIRPAGARARTRPDLASGRHRDIRVCEGKHLRPRRAEHLGRSLGGLSGRRDVDALQALGAKFTGAGRVGQNVVRARAGAGAKHKAQKKNGRAIEPHDAPLRCSPRASHSPGRGGNPLPEAQRLQNTGVKITSTARISSRPSSMAKDRIHLAESGTAAKLPAGPIIGPKPGPTLVIEASEPDTQVSRSRPVAASSTVKTAHITKKAAMNSTTARCVSSETGRSP